MGAVGKDVSKERKRSSEPRVACWGGILRFEKEKTKRAVFKKNPSPQLEKITELWGGGSVLQGFVGLIVCGEDENHAVIYRLRSNESTEEGAPARDCGTKNVRGRAILTKWVREEGC